MPHKDPEIRREYVRRYNAGWRKENSARAKTIAKRHYVKNRDKRIALSNRISRLKRYGLTPERYETMLMDQHMKRFGLAHETIWTST